MVWPIFGGFKVPVLSCVYMYLKYMHTVQAKKEKQQSHSNI